MRKGIKKALKGHTDPTPEAADKPEIRTETPEPRLTARHKPRAKLYQDGSIEPPTAALVSPQDATPVLIDDGTVYDDSENEYPVSEVSGSRASNRLRKFFGL